MMVYFLAKSAWTYNWERTVGPELAQERRRRLFVAESLPPFLKNIEKAKIFYWEALTFYEATHRPESPVPHHHQLSSFPPPPPITTTTTRQSLASSAPPVMTSPVRNMHRRSTLEPIQE